MIRHEINIVFSNRINRLVLLFLLVVAVVLSIFAVWSVSYVDKDGITHNGLFAARQLTEAKAEYAGKLDSDIFEDIVNKDKRIKNEYGNKILFRISKRNRERTVAGRSGGKNTKRRNVCRGQLLIGDGGFLEIPRPQLVFIPEMWISYVERMWIECG